MCLLHFRASQCFPCYVFRHACTHISYQYIHIAYARKHVHPKLSADAKKVIRDFYLKLRKDHQSNEGTPITTRQLEGMRVHLNQHNYFMCTFTHPSAIHSFVQSLTPLHIFTHSYILFHPYNHGSYHPLIPSARETRVT